MFRITVVKCLQRRSCSVPAKLAKYFPHTKQAKDICIIFAILNIHLTLVKHVEHNPLYQVNRYSVIESLVCYSSRKFFIVFIRALYIYFIILVLNSLRVCYEAPHAFFRLPNTSSLISKNILLSFMFWTSLSLSYLSVFPAKLIVIRFQWTVSRSSPNPKAPGEASDFHVYNLEALVDGKSNPQRQLLINMLNGTRDKALIPNIFPKFLKVSNRGTAAPITQLMEPIGKSLI